MKRFVVALSLAVFAAACDEHLATAPPVSTSSTLSAASVAQGVDARVDVAAAIEDARSRILPGLGSAVETAELAAALDQLASALQNDRGSLNPAIQQAEHAIESLQNAVKRDAGRSADLQAVRLAVEQADHLDG